MSDCANAFSAHNSILDTCHTLIVGAGLTGLSCAYHLEQSGQLGERAIRIIEKEAEPGGVVRTQFRPSAYGDFACDGTGHWLHLRDPAMRELVPQLIPGGLAEYERKAVIHLAGCF